MFSSIVKFGFSESYLRRWLARRILIDEAILLPGISAATPPPSMRPASEGGRSGSIGLRQQNSSVTAQGSMAESLGYVNFSEPLDRVD
jgi:hypothetical protein